MQARSQILAALTGGDSDARASALTRLESLEAIADGELVAALLALLASADKQLRRRAAGVLAATAGEQLGLLRAALCDSDPQRRWGAAFALQRGGHADEDVFAVALEAIGEDDADVRWSAAGVVCQAVSRHPRLADRLAHTVATGTSAQRKMALYSLRDLGLERVDVYLAALKDEDSGVRLAALAALGSCVGASALVSARLELCRDGDADVGVRRAATAALEKIMRDEDDLAAKTCVPCHGGVPVLSEAEQQGLLARVADWQLVDGHHLRRNFEFRDFVSALAFVNSVGEIAEKQGHHPDIHLAWGKVGVEIWTHAVDGLTESDFILAAKIDRLCL